MIIVFSKVSHSEYGYTRANWSRKRSVNDAFRLSELILGQAPRKLPGHRVGGSSIPSETAQAASQRARGKSNPVNGGDKVDHVGGSTA